LCTCNGPEGISFGYNVRKVGTVTDTQQTSLKRLVEEDTHRKSWYNPVTSTVYVKRTKALGLNSARIFAH
jgi:hypothetical protein